MSINLPLTSLIASNTLEKIAPYKDQCSTLEGSSSNTQSALNGRAFKSVKPSIFTPKASRSDPLPKRNHAVKKNSTPLINFSVKGSRFIPDSPLNNVGSTANSPFKKVLAKASQSDNAMIKDWFKKYSDNLGSLEATQLKQLAIFEKKCPEALQKKLANHFANAYQSNDNRTTTIQSKALGQFTVLFRNLSLPCMTAVDKSIIHRLKANKNHLAIERYQDMQNGLQLFFGLPRADSANHHGYSKTSLVSSADKITTKRPEVSSLTATAPALHQGLSESSEWQTVKNAGASPLGRDSLLAHGNDQTLKSGKGSTVTPTVALNEPEVTQAMALNPLESTEKLADHYAVLFKLLASKKNVFLQTIRPCKQGPEYGLQDAKILKVDLAKLLVKEYQSGHFEAAHHEAPLIRRLLAPEIIASIDKSIIHTLQANNNHAALREYRALQRGEPPVYEELQAPIQSSKLDKDPINEQIETLAKKEAEVDETESDQTEAIETKKNEIEDQQNSIQELQANEPARLAKGANFPEAEIKRNAESSGFEEALQENKLAYTHTESGAKDPRPSELRKELIKVRVSDNLAEHRENQTAFNHRQEELNIAEAELTSLQGEVAELNFKQGQHDAQKDSQPTSQSVPNDNAKPLLNRLAGLGLVGLTGGAGAAGLFAVNHSKVVPKFKLRSAKSQAVQSLNKPVNSNQTQVS